MQFIIGLVILLGTLFFMKFCSSVVEDYPWLKKILLLLLLIGLVNWILGAGNILKDIGG